MGWLNDITRPADPKIDLVGRTRPIVEKARHYLGEGEESPEGSEEQQGPRGGRYYEEGGKPSVGEPDKGDEGVWVPDWRADVDEDDNEDVPPVDWTPDWHGMMGVSEEDDQQDVDEADTGKGPTEMEQFRHGSGEARDRIIDGWEDEELTGAYRDLLEVPSQGNTPLLEELDQEYQRRGYEPGAIAGGGGL